MAATWIKKNIPLYHAGDPIDLCAILKHNDPNARITWKKQVFAQEDIKAQKHRISIWAPKDEGRTFTTGATCVYKFEKADEGKYIKFYAMINAFLLPDQSEIFFVDPILTTDVRIKSVTGTKEAMVDDTVKYRIDKYSNPDDRVSQNTRKNVKWMVKIDGKEERLTVDDEVILGENISFKIPAAWKGKNVTLMPFLNQHTPDISIMIKIDNNNKVVVFFIGGAGDKESYYGFGPTYIVRDEVLAPFNEQVKIDLGDSIYNTRYSSYYLSYNEAKGSSDINKVETKIPNKEAYVYIIGHSLGGWNGAHLSKILTNKGYNVEMLITLDPVGKADVVQAISDIYAAEPKPKSKFWINIEASATNREDDDWIALIGGKWRPRSGYNINHKCNTHHGYAKTMFECKLDETGSVKNYLLNSIKKIL